MAVINIYTQAQVLNALQRGLVALLLISQKIQAEFIFFNSSRYITYKNIQYDIFCLYTTVNNENSYISYSSLPNVYEEKFYLLVGALIKKTKTVDVFGAYGGSLNPNYQAPNTIIEVIIPFTITLNRTDADLIDAQPNEGVWYLPFVDDNGQAITNRVPVSVTDNGVGFDFRFDETTVPARIYGFANNDAPQVIIVKAI